MSLESHHSVPNKGNNKSSTFLLQTCAPSLVLVIIQIDAEEWWVLESNCNNFRTQQKGKNHLRLKGRHYILLLMAIRSGIETTQLRCHEPKKVKAIVCQNEGSRCGDTMGEMLTHWWQHRRLQPKHPQINGSIFFSRFFGLQHRRVDILHRFFYFPQQDCKSRVQTISMHLCKSEMLHRQNINVYNLSDG